MAAVMVPQMEDGGKAFAVFVMFTVKTVAVYGLLHKITSYDNNTTLSYFGRNVNTKKDDVVLF